MKRLRNKDIASATLKYTEGRFKSIESESATTPIKKEETILEFLARGGRITRLPPARPR